VRGRARMIQAGTRTCWHAQPSSMIQLTMQPCCPSSNPGKSHGAMPMAGIASFARGKDWPPYPVMPWPGGLGTQARQIVLGKPGARQAPYTCTRMWDVAGPSNDPCMHILRTLLDCCWLILQFLVEDYWFQNCVGILHETGFVPTWLTP
jgi:hypothetical protein